MSTGITISTADMLANVKVTFTFNGEQFQAPYSKANDVRDLLSDIEALGLTDEQGANLLRKYYPL